MLRPGKAIYRQGSSGDKVRELQARLKQIGWFSGSVTGTYGSATASGVRGFQAKRGDPRVTGEVDARTLEPARRDDPDADRRRQAQPACPSRRRPGSTAAA